MQKIEMQQKANEMLLWFEVSKFENRLSHSRKMNLLFEFCDYLNAKSDWELADDLGVEDKAEAVEFRHFVNQGADQWLDTVKTICLQQGGEHEQRHFSLHQQDV